MAKAKKTAKTKKATVKKGSAKKVTKPKSKPKAKAAKAKSKIATVKKLALDAIGTPAAVRGVQTPLNVRNSLLAMGVIAVAGLIALGYYTISNKQQPRSRFDQAALSEPKPQTAPAREVATAESSALQEQFGQASKMSFQERVEFWSKFVSDNDATHAKVKSLAEGRQINDSVPVVPDEYNCTTFVETVAALARSNRASEFYDHLMAIRYRGAQPTYESRNHFPELDWIPNNTTAGILKDITVDVAGAAGVMTKQETKTFDRATWLADNIRKGKVGRSIATVAEKQWSQPVKGKVEYIAFEDISKIAEKVPSGTIVNFVHKNDPAPKHPVLISHQGYVIKEKGKLYLRHASIGGNVKTVELSAYINTLRKQESPRSKYPLVGVNFNQLIGG